MANGFGSIYVGQSGLQSAQNALNTTSNNLANVDTKGYVRQQVRFSDKSYNVLKNPLKSVNIQQYGLGVSIGDVVHARNIFLDKTYRLERGREAFYETCYETTSHVEDLFQELNGEEFKTSVKDLWVSFQELAKMPADSVNQNLVLQKAELLISRSQSLYYDLQSYQSNINEQIKDDVAAVNEIGNRIYELNLEIQSVESNGQETATTLRDERDRLLDELGSYTKYDSREDASGFVYVEIEGVNFVYDAGCNNMDCKIEKGTGFATPYWPQLSEPEREQYVKVWKDDGDISTEGNTDVGSIKCKLYLRGDRYGNFSDLADMDSYAKVEDRIMMEVEAEIDLLLHDIATTLNDIFCPNKEMTLTTDLYDSNGNLIHKAGDTIKVLDEENCAVGADGKLPPRELFQRMNCERYTTYTIDGKEYYVYNEEDLSDSTTLYRIGNIQVNEELTKQATLLPAFKQDGKVAYDLAEALAAAWENKGMHIDPTDEYPCTFQEFYDKIIGKLGTDGNIYYSSAQTLTNTTTSIDNSRSQLTGVSSDEELTKLIKYQSAYNAASRYITVISQMTELIVTGLI